MEDEDKDAALSSAGKRDGILAVPRTPVTREALYEEVWAAPMTAVAARYGVSGSFLARVCTRLNVPRPPRGYWARLEYGRAPKRPALPAMRPQDEVVWSRGAEPVRVPRPLPAPPQATRRPHRRAAATRPSLHALIRGAREHFDAVRERDDDYLRPSKKLLVDLVVSKGALARALEIANELFLLLEDRGHAVSFAPPHDRLGRNEVDVREIGGRTRTHPTFWSPWRPTVVFVGTVAIGLTIFETSKEIECRWLDGKYVPLSELRSSPRGRYSAASSWTTMRELPTGRLCLQAYAPYRRADWVERWRESKPGDLPGKLKTIARTLEEAAPVIARQVEEGERQAELERLRWEEQERERRRQEAARRRAEALKTSRAELAAIIERWAEAKRVDAFFEDAEQRAASMSEEDATVVLERLKRARDLLGGVDALERFKGWKAPEERSPPAD